jgi:transposase
MSRALSTDLRERVLAAHERREGSQRVLAERFGIAVGTVNGWLQQAREGRRAPRQGGRRRPLGGADPQVLAAMVAERPDATLAEYAGMLAARVGQRFSLAALCRALRRAGLRRKKDAPRKRAGAPRHRCRAGDLARRGDGSGRSRPPRLPR